MGPVIPELLGGSRESKGDLGYVQQTPRGSAAGEKDQTRREVVLSGTVWQALKSYAGNALMPVVAGLSAFLGYMVWNAGHFEGSFNQLVITSMLWGLAVCAGAYLIYVPIACYLVVLVEKHEWNGGICAETGGAWQASGRDWDSGALKFIAPTDRLVHLAGNVWFGYLRPEYHYTLMLEYTRPAADEDQVKRSAEPIRYKTAEQIKRSLPLPLWGAAAIILSTFSTVYWLAGLQSIIALSAVGGVVCYYAAKLSGNTEFGSWTIVMAMQLALFGSLGVDPGIHMFGAMPFILGLLGLLCLAVVAVAAADR